MFLDATVGEVVKTTRVGTFGEYYEVKAGRIVEYDSTPGEYLNRMRLWERLFENAPVPLGVSPAGQVVTRQRYIAGLKPTQAEVDAFLLEAGLEPVRQKFWIWRRFDEELGIGMWVGDVRADNFVETPHGLVPIDIRIRQGPA